MSDSELSSSTSEAPRPHSSTPPSTNFVRKSLWLRVHEFHKKHRIKLIASVVLTAALLWGLQRGGMTLVPKGGTFSQVRWWTVVLYCFMFFVTATFRATRWKYLLRPIEDIPSKRVLFVNWVGTAAILLLPFRLGEMVRPYLIRSKRTSVSAALGTVVSERVFDGLYVTVILAVALLLVPTMVPLPEKVVGIPIKVSQVRFYAYVMLAIFGGASLVIVVFYLARKLAHKLTLLTIGLVSKKLAEALAVRVEHLADGMKILARPREAIPFLIETTLYWFTNILGMWFLAWGCGVVHADGTAITFGESCSLLGTLAIAILIPGPPGMIGVFQAGLFSGMTMYFPEHIVQGPGAAFVFIMYLTQVALTVLSAAVVMWTSKDVWSSLERQTNHL